jgi:putative NIF3 family GTP cyclohydrolase 1 type 2
MSLAPVRLAGALCLLVVAGSAARLSAAPPPTAQQLIDRITTGLNGYWPATGNDGLKDGDPATPVTGVAVTMMSTMDVLERAAGSGSNFVITHEPTFYSGNDSLVRLEQENDAVTAAKRAFIREHHMVVFRIHDHWHFPLRVPDPVITGVFRALDWSQYQHDKSQPLLRLAPTTVKALALDISRRLDIRAMRVVGDPDMPVTKVGFLPGCPPWDMQRAYLQRDDVEVLVIGEAREWETIEYAADMETQGRRKALIVLGHVPSEQAGSGELVRWLRPRVPEVPVQEVTTAEPFWSPR